MIIRFPSGRPEAPGDTAVEAAISERRGPMFQNHPVWGLIGLAVCLALLFLADIYLGSVRIGFGKVLETLLGRAPSDSIAAKIVLLFRLPKALTALLSGAALAVAGLQMQTIFRNPLAGPFVLGINSGASLGVAVIVLALGASTGAAFLESFGVGGQICLALAAALGAAAVLLLVLSFSTRVRGMMTLLVLGLLFGYAVSAVVSILIQWSSADRIQAYVAWTFGSFGGVTLHQLPVFAPVLGVAIGASQLAAKQLDALLLGEQYAVSMGVRVRRVRVLIILLTALLAGTVTAFCGPIAFIGVAVPHLMRSLFSSSSHRLLLPSAALMGSIAALASDIISHVPGTELILPLNAVTALIGAPVVIWVILGRNNLRETFGS